MSFVLQMLMSVFSLWLVLSSVHGIFEEHLKVEYNWENSYSLISDTTPVNGNLPNKMSVRCAVQDPDRRLREVSRMAIEVFGEKMHAQIATNPPQGLPNIVKYCDGCEAQGKIEGTTSDPYFEVLRYGDKASRRYSCFADVVDKDEGSKTLRVDGETRVSNGTPTLDDVVQAFRVTTSKLEALKASRGQDLIASGGVLTRERSGLRSLEERCDHDVNTFQWKIDAKEDRMKRMMQESEEPFRVMFIAKQNQEDVFDTSGMSALKYSDVLVNEGGGYNERTGRFTAPVPGYYLFHFSVFISTKAYVYLDLKTDDHVLKTILGGGEKKGRGGGQSWRFSDGRFVVKLDINQAVYLSVSGAGGTVTSNSFRNVLYPNRFDGYLLHPSAA